MNLTDVGLTREIERSAAVQASEQACSKRLKKVKCSKCGTDISTIAMEDDAVCRGVWTRCKCPICHDWFEIRINTDKIKD